MSRAPKENRNREPLLFREERQNRCIPIILNLELFTVDKKLFPDGKLLRVVFILNVGVELPRKGFVKNSVHLA